MKSVSLSRRRALVLAGLAATLPSGAFAQAYPSSRITLIVPAPAGGTPDIVARQFAQQLGGGLGQVVVVDNRAGAGGIVGVSAVAKAPPDGYTLLMGFAQTMAINPIAFKKLPYDPVADFVPVARLVEFELALVVSGSVPVKNMTELQAWLENNSARAAFGSFGIGTPSHFAGEMFNRKSGSKAVHVAYKGSAPLVTELVGGQVQFGFVVPQIAMPHVKSGNLRMLAVTGAQRSASMPAVPTMKELGFEDVVAGGWYGLFAPKGTPVGVIDRIGKAVAAAMKSPELTKLLREQDLRPAYQPPGEFAGFQQTEIARWRAVAARTNFRAEE